MSVLGLKVGYTEPSRNLLGSALGISLVLRLYFIVYPSFCHKTDTMLQLAHTSFLADQSKARGYSSNTVVIIY